MHSDIGYMVLTRSYLVINFPLQRTEVEALLKCLRKRNRVMDWSETGYQILGQV